MGNPQLQITELFASDAHSLQHESKFLLFHGKNDTQKLQWVFFFFCLYDTQRKKISINEIISVRAALIPRHSREGESL